MNHERDFEESVGTCFHSLTTFQPHPFQQEAIAAILSGRNILLRAPIGAGRTEPRLPQNRDITNDQQP
ncbi:hypothetical protein IQ268_17425 [Oculatella sp. LEGE 06141]|uniref:hypothetical protein n=1 Tax=Oculatella sp. LEGE 06141 TaxID=1828648 RepID=UPI00187EB2E8|nr:hypothetical protein [Oculatella sp. LEGE 06141]MBE9180346.1 hypothetical protein [Oculatella sp. LEGE 06141]